MENEAKKIDIRIIKTKRAIREATLRLLSTKSIEDISITELAEEAQINRKTFYNYYQSIYQVLDEIENEAVEKFVLAIKESDWYDGEVLDFYKLFLSLTESIRVNMSFYAHFLKISKTSRLITKVEARLKEKAKSYFPRYLDLDEVHLTMALDYVISGIFSVYRRWVLSGQKLSVDEVAKNVGIMSIGAVNAILDAYSVNIEKLSFETKQ